MVSRCRFCIRFRGRSERLVDILSRVDVVDDNHTDRVLVEHVDEGANLHAQVADLHRLISAYRTGLIKEQPTKDTIW